MFSNSFINLKFINHHHHHYLNDRMPHAVVYCCAPYSCFVSRLFHSGLQRNYQVIINDYSYPK